MSDESSRICLIAITSRSMSLVPRRSSIRKGFLYPLVWLAFLAGVGATLYWQSQQAPEPPDRSELPIAYFESLQHEGEGAIPELLEWLESEDVADRRGAALALFRLRSTNADARASLLRHLDDPDVQVRQHSIATLKRVGIHLPRLVGDAAELLGDHSDETRRWAKDLLLSMGRDAAPYMIPLLSHTRPDTRLLAGKIFQDVGGWDPNFDPVLLQIIRDQAASNSRFPRPDSAGGSSEVTREAHALSVENSNWRIATLDQIPGPEFDCVAMGQLLAPYLDHEQSDVRRSATRLLGILGPGCRNAVIRQLDHPNEDSKRHALHLLSGYRVFDQTLLQQMRGMFQDDRNSVEVRSDALAMIIASGEATDDEIRLALQPQSAVCPGVLEMFSRAPERSIEFLDEVLLLLDDEKQQFHSRVLQTLGRLESLPERATARIRALLPVGNPWMRVATAYALRHSAVDRPNVESTVADIVVAGELHMPAAVKALLDLAPDAVPMTVERLRPQLRDGPPARRRQAFVAIALLGPRAAAALPEVQQALDGDDREWQWFAFLAIAGLGPEASPCIPRLIELLTDLSEYKAEGPSVEAAYYTMCDAYMVEAVTAKASESSRAVGQLATSIKQEPTPDARFQRILAAIEHIGSSGMEALPAVLRSLNQLESLPEPAPFGYTRRWRIRRCALVQTLARIAPDDHEVTARLHGLLTDPFSEARFWSAALLLDREGPGDECVRALAELASGSTHVTPRYMPLNLQGDSIPKLAALQLMQLGQHASSAIDALVDGARQRPNDPLRNASLQALGAIIADVRKSGSIPPVVGLIPVLKDALYSSDRAARFTAVRSLGLLGPSAEACVADLEGAARAWENGIPDLGAQVWLTRTTDDECLGVVTAVLRGPTLREEIHRALEQIRPEQ